MQATYYKKRERKKKQTNFDIKNEFLLVISVWITCQNFENYFKVQLLYTLSLLCAYMKIEKEFFMTFSYMKYLMP